MTEKTKNDLIERLWGSDAASALTNEAARHIEAQEALIQEMREALESIYRHIDSPENYDRHIDAICDSILSKAKPQQEGETE